MSTAQDFDFSRPVGDILADKWKDVTNYSTEPIKWVTDKLGEFLWSEQRAIFESVRDNRYTAVHSAHDLGKSKVAANIISWWIDSHPPGEAFVVSTAPTAAQVSAILWREIGKNMTKSKKRKYDNELEAGVEEIPGKINRAGYPQWYVDGELVGYGRKPADYEESAFQGIHARYVLIIVDEACGVARHLFDAVDALATNKNARVLAIGNPDDPGSHFAAICKPNSGWSVIHLDGLRSPNMTKNLIIGKKSEGFGYEHPRFPLLTALMEAERIPYSREFIPEDLRPMLIDAVWIEERIQRWGGLPSNAAEVYSQDELKEIVQRRAATSPLFQSKVRGVFPSGGSNGIIPLGWVQLAVNRWHDAMDENKTQPNGLSLPASLRAIVPGRKIVGADPGDSANGDESAISVRYGNLVEKIERFRRADTMETADMIAVHLHETGSIAVVDSIGIGAGVCDRLKQMRRMNQILGTAMPFTASAQSGRTDFSGEFRFRNDRAAAWWNMRELLDPSRGSTVALPDDEQLIEELVAVRYKPFVGGIIQVEAKDEIRKRLGRSTDTADSVIQSFWVHQGTEVGEAIPWRNAEDSVGAVSGVMGGHDGGVIRYDGYDPFTDTDLAQTPGLGAGTVSRGGFEDWD